MTKFLAILKYFYLLCFMLLGAYYAVHHIWYDNNWRIMLHSSICIHHLIRKRQKPGFVMCTFNPLSCMIFYEMKI